MNNLKLTDDDYKLCELYKKTNDENILLEFYKKFSTQICNLIFYKINKKMYSIPFEYDDIKHIIWKVIKTSFTEYKPENKDYFMIYLLNNAYQTTLREVRKFLTNGEKLMNNVLSYDEWINKNRKFIYKSDNIVYNQKSYKESYKEISDFIIERISNLNLDDVKKVIYLRSLGYSNVKIEKTLSFNRTYVRKIINTIVKIGKKY